MLHADLEASGLGRYQFHLLDTGGINATVRYNGDKVYAAALPDGSFDVSHERWVDYDHLTETKDFLLAIAGSAQDALFEVEGVIWPRCAEHHDRLATPEPAPGSPDGWPVWWCHASGGHVPALIGHLRDQLGYGHRS